MINWALLTPRNLLLIAAIAIAAQIVIGPLLPASPAEAE